MKVMYIACNPDDGGDLMLEREITELQRKALQSSGAPVQFTFLPALTVEELPVALSTYAPDILHISAHGEDEALLVANAGGGTFRLTAQMLEAFLPYERPPKLIYLNACDSWRMAQAMVVSGAIQYAIGTTAPITNRAARSAAVLFYDRILRGATIKDAFSTGQKMMEGLQDKTVSSQLYSTGGAESLSHRLYSVPRIVAKPDSGRYDFDRDGTITLEIQLIGAPPNTLQVVFFTDDKSFIYSDADDDETDAAFLARELCQVVRDTPKRGKIVAPDLWPTDEDFRIFACGTTADGNAFNVATTICEAMQDYGRYVRRELLTGDNALAVAAAVNRLQDAGSLMEVALAEPLQKVALKSSAAKKVVPLKEAKSSPSTKPKSFLSQPRTPRARTRTIKAAAKKK